MRPETGREDPRRGSSVHLAGRKNPGPWVESPAKPPFGCQAPTRLWFGPTFRLVCTVPSSSIVGWDEKGAGVEKSSSGRAPLGRRASHLFGPLITSIVKSPPAFALSGPKSKASDIATRRVEAFGSRNDHSSRVRCGGERRRSRRASPADQATPSMERTSFSNVVGAPDGFEPILQ